MTETHEILLCRYGVATMITPRPPCPFRFDEDSGEKGRVVGEIAHWRAAASMLERANNKVRNWGEQMAGQISRRAMLRPYAQA
jgi:hypothetical protein